MDNEREEYVKARAFEAAVEDYAGWADGCDMAEEVPASWEEAAAEEMAKDEAKGWPEAAIFGGPYSDEELTVYYAAYAREFCHRGYDADKARDERKARAAQ